MTRRFQMRTGWRTILWILAIGCLLVVGPMHSELAIATDATAGSADVEVETSAAPRLTDLVDDLQSLGFYSRKIQLHTMVEAWDAEPIGQLFRDVERIESEQLRGEIREVAVRRLANDRADCCNGRLSQASRAAGETDWWPLSTRSGLC